MTPEQQVAAATEIYIQHGIIPDPAQTTSGKLGAVVALHQAQRDMLTRAHEVLGELIQRVPTTRVSDWTFRAHGTYLVEGRLVLGIFGHEARAAIMLVAEQFDLNYTVKKSIVADKNTVAAAGKYREVPVRVYDLLPPCYCQECKDPR